MAGVRVKQQNLVYVIGLVPDLKDEPKLLQTLRGKDYFGQYCEIEKIVVSKAKPGQTNQGVGVYVTFARKEDAAVCIAAIDGTKNEDRLLRYVSSSNFEATPTDSATGLNTERQNTALRIFVVRNATTRAAAFCTRQAKMARRATYRTSR